MDLRFEEDLVETSCMLAASGACAGLPSLQVARFHREREKLYSIPDPDDRNAAFFKLHLEWFREWNLERLLTAPLAAFPLLSTALGILAYRQSRVRNDEGAELYVNAAGDRSGVVCLRPGRLGSPVELDVFLSHELMHLQDMVDPAFGYRAELPGAGPSPNQQRVARERYRLLWDMSIDGRLSRTHRQTVTTRQARWAEFLKAFDLWPAARQAEVFDVLWSNPKPNHAQFDRLIGEYARLRCTAGASPGAPCPLCGFTTFAWAPASPLEDQILNAVRREFPQWQLEQGLCRRCAEVYAAAVDQTALSHD
jgi:hypothetical protein